MGGEMTAGMAVKVVVSLCFVGACSLGLYLYYVLWLVPERVRRELRRQGIGGPRPSFPDGNLADMRQAAVAAKSTSAVTAEQSSSSQRAVGIVHDYRPTVFPFYEKWRKEYDRQDKHRTTRPQIRPASDGSRTGGSSLMHNERRNNLEEEDPTEEDLMVQARGKQENGDTQTLFKIKDEGSLRAAAFPLSLPSFQNLIYPVDERLTLSGL